MPVFLVGGLRHFPSLLSAQVSGFQSRHFKGVNKGQPEVTRVNQRVSSAREVTWWFGLKVSLSDPMAGPNSGSKEKNRRLACIQDLLPIQINGS